MSVHCTNGVDVLVEPLLPDFGYACDVGANDGHCFSNTYHFEEKGWIVLCVEANPGLEEIGRSRRKLWRPVGAGAEDRIATFYAHGGGSMASASGFVHKSGVSAQVQMLRLDRILEEAGFPRLDFLTVDSEGYEVEVMKGFDIERWKPRVIVLEDYPDGTSLVAPAGYRMIDRKEFDNVYVREA